METLAEAVAAVKGGMSIRVAEDTFGIPHSTIRDHASGDHGSMMGHPPELNEVEEAMLKDMVKLLADWGFPFTSVDLCHFVKCYLDKKGTVSKRFKDNLPTHRWVARFLGRHKDLTLRKTNAIKRSRGAVSREEVNESSSTTSSRRRRGCPQRTCSTMMRLVSGRYINFKQVGPRCYGRWVGRWYV